MGPNLPGSGLGLLLAEAEMDPTQKPSCHAPDLSSNALAEPQTGSPQYEWKIVWQAVFYYLTVHTSGLYGLYLVFTHAKVATILWTIFAAWYSLMGITAGVHRLWAHKCYKAKLPLRILLAFCNASAFQYCIYYWARDHRLHHKFVDTDADPHNSSRGFFFSHVGWLLVRKHEDVKAKGKVIDMSDLENDPVVMWQKRLFPVLMPLCTFVIPAWIPWYCWGEDGWTSWFVATMLRYAFTLEISWMVNSVAHLWGTKPYNKFIAPVENLFVAMLTCGEGWHNYHHTFPWDYKTSEFSAYRKNFTTAFIDFFARIGWAYDLKTVSPETIVRRVNRTGDGSHPAMEADEIDSQELPRTSTKSQ